MLHAARPDADTRRMDHVSRPLLIVLAATVALMAVWVVALRPKPPAVESTPLAPTKAISQASQASAISATTFQEVEAVSGEIRKPSLLSC